MREVPGAAKDLGEFITNAIWQGGDVGGGDVYILPPSRVAGGKEVVSGISIGGFKECKQAVVDGTLTPAEVRFFHKKAGWGPGQLSEELADGVWFLASASANLILGEPPATRENLWSEMLKLMGGEYKEMAEAIESQTDESGEGWTL